MVAAVNAAKTYKKHPYYDIMIDMDGVNSESVQDGARQVDMLDILGNVTGNDKIIVYNEIE